MSLRASLLLSLMIAVAGCPKQGTGPDTVDPSEQSARAQAGAEEAAEAREVDPLCAASPSSGPPSDAGLPGLQATRSGTTLSFPETGDDGPLVFGVLGPINEASGRNRIALERYRAFFEAEGVDAVIVTGDAGEVAEGIAQVLGELTRLGRPVFTIIGNRECASVYDEGVRAAQEASPLVVNLNAIREVRFPQATLISIPGHDDPDFITCESGCRFDGTTVDEAIALARNAPSPAVLVAHGPPRGQGSQALDFANTGANVGSEEIRRALDEGGFAFGVFSNIKEAGARATDSTGTTIIPEGQASQALFLNPGPADMTSWSMNDGKPNHGFAAILSIEDGAGTWKLYRGAPLTQEERARARALDAE